MSQSHINSISSLVALLERYIIGSSTFDGADQFLRCLKSQGGLASYNNPEIGVTPMALNTMKQEAKFLPQGFYTLDQLRKSALKVAISTQSVSIPARQKPKQDREYEKQIRALGQENMRLTGFVFELRKLCQQLATSNFTDPKKFLLKRLSEIDRMTQRS